MLSNLKVGEAYMRGFWAYCFLAAHSNARHFFLHLHTFFLHSNNMKILKRNFWMLILDSELHNSKVRNNLENYMTFSLRKEQMVTRSCSMLMAPSPEI